MNAPFRIPPVPAGFVRLLQLRGHTVVIRQQRTGSLRYRIDGGRELTALQMDRFFSKRYEARK